MSVVELLTSGDQVDGAGKSVATRVLCLGTPPQLTQVVADVMECESDQVDSYQLTDPTVLVIAEAEFGMTAVTFQQDRILCS